MWNSVGGRSIVPAVPPVSDCDPGARRELLSARPHPQSNVRALRGRPTDPWVLHRQRLSPRAHVERFYRKVCADARAHMSHTPACSPLHCLGPRRGQCKHGPTEVKSAHAVIISFLILFPIFLFSSLNLKFKFEFKLCHELVLIFECTL